MQLVCAPPDTTDPARRQSTASGRGCHARRGAAAETTWQFPLPQHLAQARPEELLKYWNEIHADRATDELLRYMVLTLRVWRPNVIVMDAPFDLGDAKTIDNLLADLVDPGGEPGG